MKIIRKIASLSSISCIRQRLSKYSRSSWICYSPRYPVLVYYSIRNYLKTQFIDQTYQGAVWEADRNSQNQAITWIVEDMILARPLVFLLVGSSIFCINVCVNLYSATDPKDA